MSRLWLVSLFAGAVILAAATGLLVGSSVGGEYVVYDCPGVRELVRSLP